MSTTVPASTTAGASLPAPAGALGVGNVAAVAKLAEKTIELTTCAQFGNLFGSKMVWFGLTQKQERQHGFDASTNLGGRAFILQFKVSSTVPKRGTYAGQRRFTCQHQQMDRLRAVFGSVPNACFYFLPNVGTFNDLVGVGGDLISNSCLVDVADLPYPIPATHRANGYHHAFLDAATPSVTITSAPFKPQRVLRARDLLAEFKRSPADGQLSPRKLVSLARQLDSGSASARLGDLFFKNAALVVLL